MLAVLCSSPRPPLGVALIGFTIAMLSWVLHLLPYLMFCGMITLSVWPPSHPPPPEVVYHPVDGLPNHVHVVYNRVSSKETTRSFELNGDLRILMFLLSLPLTSIVENALFYPARRFFLQTIECWFDMRYVHPAQLTGSWPDTWTPILNALRSCEFVADFIDSAAGWNPGTNLSHTAEPHTSGPCAGTDTSGGSHSTAQPAEQSAPSRKYECASSPEPIAHSKPDFSTNVPRARKTFVSPPRVSSQSPWKANGLGGLSPVSKNLSRIVGTLFHHTPPRKPVIRRRINLMAKDPSPRVPPHVLERLWSSNENNFTPAWAHIPSFKTAIRDTVVPWHDGAQMLRSAWDHVSDHLVAAAPEPIAERSLPPCIDSQFFPGTYTEAQATEQTRFEQQQCWGYVHPSLTSPLHHVSPPVYCQQEVLNHQKFSTSVALMQHGSHAFSDGPDQPMAAFESLPPPVLESPLPAFSSLSVAPQEQFTFQLLDHAPPFQFSQDAAPRFGPQSAPPTTAPHNEYFHSPPSDAPPEAAVWSHYRHQSSPTFTSQPPRHIGMEQPFWGLGVAGTGTFTFEVSQVTPYFDFSHQVPSPPQPHYGTRHPTAALPSDIQIMMSGGAPLRQLSSVDQGVQTPRDSPSLQPSPAKQAGVAEPSTKGAKMTVDNSDDDDDDDYSSNSDSDMDSDSDSDSSDTDTDTDSEDEDEDEDDDAMATETVCKTSSRAPDDVQRVPAAKDASAPAHDALDSDSDSDEGYFEHISTPAPAGDEDEDDSSDEDMSDHEEEDRLYWEMLYAPRHRRQQQPQVSVGSI